MTTFQQIIDDARVLLNDVVLDETTVTRYTESQMLTYAREALVAARRLRPDLFLSNLTGPIPAFTADDALPLDERYKVAIVDYIVHRSEIRDDEFVVSGKAEMMFTKFKSAFIGL
jgi:hypothetical protein